MGWALAFALAPPFAGCTSYEEDPAPPLDLLSALEEVRLEDVSPDEVAPVVTAFQPRDGLTLREACAVAVRHNPRLLALRAQVGVSEAQLVQAGLLSDPVIGWGYMDPASGLIVDGKAESPSWLSGFSLTWQVPRPGEIGAREGVAEAGVEGAQAALSRAEWGLVREVHLAYLRLLVAQAASAQTARLAEVAKRAEDYFAKARGAGATTALEEGLARVAAKSVQADALGAKNEAVQARQALNALLGLSPRATWALQDSLPALVSAEARGGDPAALVRASLERRPDLQAWVAAYRQAEERLRLACAGQWPRFQIGTSFSLSIPIFTRFNQPAIQTALRSREVARRRMVSAVHEARREIHAATAQLAQSRAILELFRTELAPLTEQTLQSAQRAFQARSVTPLEILTAQRQVLETQSRSLRVRQAWAEARIRLESACGTLLPSARTFSASGGEARAEGSVAAGQKAREDSQ